MCGRISKAELEKGYLKVNLYETLKQAANVLNGFHESSKHNKEFKQTATRWTHGLRKTLKQPTKSICREKFISI